MYHVLSGVGRIDLAVTFVGCPRSAFVQKRLRTDTKCPRRKRKVSSSRTTIQSADKPSLKDSLSEELSESGHQDSSGEDVRFTAAESGQVMFMAIADEFDMPALSRRLIKCKTEYGGVATAAHGPVLRVVKPSSSVHATAETFVFPYGCMVVWGTKDDSDDFLSLVIDDALELRPTPLVDSMAYVYGEHGSLRREFITLEARSSSV